MRNVTILSLAALLLSPLAKLYAADEPERWTAAKANE